MPRSAGEHPWREVQVRLVPLGPRLQVSVYTRRHRGTDLVWQRSLGRDSVDLPPGSDTSVAGLLRLASDVLASLADQATGL